MTKSILWILSILIAFSIGYFLRGYPKKDSQYILKKPLRIVTNKKTDEYYLPPETTLYLDWIPPEGGFNRYRLYLNIHGPDLEMQETEKRGEINPMTAFWEVEK